MPIQSILFPVDKFTKAQANKWLKENGYKTTFHGKEVHQTASYLRYRQLAPQPQSKVRYRTITIDKGKGIKAITEYPKKG